MLKIDQQDHYDNRTVRARGSSNTKNEKFCFYNDVLQDQQPNAKWIQLTSERQERKNCCSGYFCQ